jgi:hypothetical protein
MKADFIMAASTTLPSDSSQLPRDVLGFGPLFYAFLAGN